MELNPLTQLNVVTIAGMIVVFWVTFVVLKVVFFNPLLDVVVARRKKVAEGRDRLAEAETILSRAGQEAERLLAEADSEVERIEGGAAEAAEAWRQERVAGAKEEADKVLVEGRDRIVRIRKKEEEKVREELVGCTTIACMRLVGKVDERLVGSIVDKVMRTRLSA
ncbi:MAG: hypothetical protein C4521_07170 [Actinobacteria bacterium]|nr:MAG: hypothetical protein C4521_07170 [Actinomycetota bacterium]